jgi:hypothetical protein
MTRHSDLACEDIFGCEHAPEIALSDGGEITGWRCVCGLKTFHSDGTTKTPADYEECGDCGFDHDYEPAQAAAWHKVNPGAYASEYFDPEDAHSPAASSCLGVIPKTYIACGEGGNYCSQECFENAEGPDDAYFEALKETPE